MKTSAVLAVMATLASAVVAAPATSSPGRNYLADALKHPETTFATSNILPIFWTPVTKGAGVDDGFHGDAPKDGHLSGSWLQGLQSEGSPLFVLLVAILACGALVAILVTATRAIVKKVD